MLNCDTILPYRYPTTVVLLDDDAQFLKSFSYRFRRDLLCRPFHKPAAAIEHIRQSASRIPRHAPGLVVHPASFGEGGLDFTDQSIAFRVTAIQDLINDPARFAEVSVAIIDYDMPGLNGIEVCRRIADLPVKKLMLTGKADEKLATAAFNEGLIDRFMIKQEDGLTDGIVPAVAQLQTRYFKNASLALEGILALQDSAFILDPAIDRFLGEVLRRERAVEYYLSAKPPGILMLRADGTPCLVLVQDEPALAACDEILAEEPGFPEPLRHGLSRRDSQIWLPLDFSIGPEAWQPYLQPAVRVGRWYCSVVEGPHPLATLPPGILSYDSWRREARLAASP
jgi:CheY-like chemotaxis protein